MNKADESVRTVIEDGKVIGECRCKSLIDGHEPGCPMAK